MTDTTNTNAENVTPSQMRATVVYTVDQGPYTRDASFDLKSDGSYSYHPGNYEKEAKGKIPLEELEWTLFRLKLKPQTPHTAYDFMERAGGWDNLRAAIKAAKTKRSSVLAEREG